jgi:hypothetical protein
MGSEFTFYDYIDADGGGANVINDWLNGNGKRAKAHFNRVIGYLENSSPAGSQDSVWRDPYVLHLHGEWKGFIEIRKKADGVQYRLIGKIENRNVFLITWGYHKGSWETEITPQTGEDRITQMNNNPARYRREHDHG